MNWHQVPNPDQPFHINFICTTFEKKNHQIVNFGLHCLDCYITINKSGPALSHIFFTIFAKKIVKLPYGILECKDLHIYVRTEAKAKHCRI